MNRTGLVFGAAAAGLVLMLPGSSRASSSSSSAWPESSSMEPYAESPPLVFDAPPIDYGDIAPDALPPIYSPEQSAPMEPANPIDYGYQGDNPAPVVNDARNLDAFLAVIRAGESSDSYTRLVGGGDFSSFDDHPAETGEWSGIRRKDGRLTTAAGAYQITRTTWRSLGGRARYGSFAPSAQDQAAVDLLKRRGAYEDVLAGRVFDAVGKLRQEWEIFTLPRWQGEQVAARFQTEGGTLA